MSSWFTLNTGGREEDDARQTSALMAHDDLEDRRGADVEEGGTIFERASAFTSEFITDIFGEDEDEGKKKKKRSASPGKKGRSKSPDKRKTGRSKSPEKKRGRSKSPDKKAKGMAPGVDLTSEMDWWQTHADSGKGKKGSSGIGAVDKVAHMQEKAVQKSVKKTTKLADEAERAAHDMEEALAWMNENPLDLAGAIPDLASQDGSQISMPSVGKFKTVSDNIDLMGTLQSRTLRQNAPGGASVSSGTSIGAGKGKMNKKDARKAKEAEERTKKMRDAVSWWSKSSDVTHFGNLESDYRAANSEAATDMTGVVEWWADTGRFYQSDPDAKLARKIKKSLEKYKQKATAAEKKAKEMAETLKKWKKIGKSYTFKYQYYEDSMDKLRKINHLFDAWELKDLPSTYQVDPIDDPKGVEKLSQDIQKALQKYMNDNGNRSISGDEIATSEDFDKIKHILIQIRMKSVSPDTTSAEVEELITWYKNEGLKLDPVDVPSDDLVWFDKSKCLFMNWGVPLPKTKSEVDYVAKEIRESISYWSRNASTPEDMLEPFELQRMRKIKHIGNEMARFVTPKQAKSAAKQLEEVLGWWRVVGAHFNPEMSSPDEYAKFNILKGIFTDWKGGPRKFDGKATKDIEEALSWWTRNSHRGFDESNFQGDELEKFRAVKQALHIWREKAAASAKLDEMEAMDFARQIEEALEQWGAMKDLKKFTPLQQVFVDKVRGIFTAFKEAKDVDGDFLVWMRNPEAIKEVLDTVTEWKKLGGKVDMKDMPTIKVPREKQLMKNLFEAMIEWRRSGAYSDLELDEAEMIAKQALL